jgi:hypothetical protein
VQQPYPPQSMPPVQAVSPQQPVPDHQQPVPEMPQQPLPPRRRRSDIWKEDWSE